MPSYKRISKDSGENWVCWSANPNYSQTEVWTITLRDFSTAGGEEFDDTVYTTDSGVRVLEHLDGSLVLTFGDGDGVRTAFLARAFDLTVHEFTHGVTQTTAGLIYRGQSGALNEGTSDIMAAVATAWAAGGAIGPNVWKIGEDVYTPLIAGDAARYMDNPILSPTGGRDWYPTRYTGAQDNGGVHWNSGIANLAFKLMVTGGRHPRLLSPVVVPALGMNLAARIWYRALTRYLPANATFRTARYATARAAFDLTRNNAVSNAVHRAWDAVGVPR